MLEPLVVVRARPAPTRLALRLLHSGSGRAGHHRDRDMIDRLVPRPVPAGGIVGRLLDLAAAVRRLPPPGRHDPERFWADKSDIAARLDELAADARHRFG